MKKAFLNSDLKPILCSLVVLLFNFSVKASKKAASPPAKIHLNIEYKQALKSDTLYVAIAEDILFSLTGDRRKQFTAVPDKRGIYHFQIPVAATSGYFILSKTRTIKRTNFTDPVRLVEPQYWELGDSINVQITRFKETTLGGDAYCAFSGRGSEKYNLVNEISHFELPSNKFKDSSEPWPKNWYGNILEFDEFDSISSYKKAVLELLESRKKRLTALSYQVIKANVIYSNQGGIFALIRQLVYDGRFNKLDQKTRQAFIQRLVHSYQYQENYSIPDSALALSIDFLTFVSGKIVTEAYLNTGGYDLDEIYRIIKKYPVSKDIKETLITKFLWSPMRGSQQIYHLYTDAKSFIKNANYIPLLEELKYKLPGRAFPELDLEDVKGKIRSLSEFKDKVVLLDFWFTGCGHCEVFYKTTLSKVEASLGHHSDIAFISVSLDQEKIKWKKSIDKGTYTSPNAINVYTKGLGFKHPVVTLNNIVGCPTVILLNKMGKIQYFNTSNLYQEQTLVEAIKELQ